MLAGGETSLGCRAGCEKLEFGAQGSGRVRDRKVWWVALRKGRVDNGCGCRGSKLKWFGRV